MANLRKDQYGENSMKQVTLIVAKYDSSVSKDGKTVFPQISIHPEDERGRGKQTAPWLSMRESQNPNTGNTRLEVSQPMPSHIFEKVAEAGEDNGFPVYNRERTEVIGQAYVIDADVYTRTPKNGPSYLAPVAESIQPSAVPAVVNGLDSLQRQQASIEALRAERATQVEAGVEEPVAETPAVEEPEVPADVEAEKAAKEAKRKAIAKARAINKAKAERDAKAAQATNDSPELG